MDRDENQTQCEPVVDARHATQAIETVATQPISTLNQQDESQRVAWRHALGEKMVEASKRMETDPSYRRRIQSMTR